MKRRAKDQPASVEAQAIPCFRCGVCCEHWSPLVSTREAKALAKFLHAGLEEFLASSAAPYPLKPETHILKHGERGCIFLRSEGGLATCSVHPARPDACRDWQASMAHGECLEGLKRLEGRD